MYDDDDRVIPECQVPSQVTSSVSLVPSRPDGMEEQDTQIPIACVFTSLHVPSTSHFDCRVSERATTYYAVHTCDSWVFVSLLAFVVRVWKKSEIRRQHGMWMREECDLKWNISHSLISLNVSRYMPLTLAFHSFNGVSST